MKETKPKQQVDDQAKQLTQESAALKNKERMYKMIGAPSLGALTRAYNYYQTSTSTMCGLSGSIAVAL